MKLTDDEKAVARKVAQEAARRAKADEEQAAREIERAIRDLEDE